MKELKIIASDAYLIHARVYEVENPVAYVQIIHGMEEEISRYQQFIDFLVENNICVIAANLRGHGKEAPIRGYFASEKGNELLVEDQVLITKKLKELYQVNTLIIFAHSMGTIITRNLLMNHSHDYQGVILSGYPNPNGIAKIGIFVAGLIKKFKGSKAFSPFLHNLAIDSFNKKIENPKTDIDWLSYNEENIKNYQENTYCGASFKVQAFIDLFKLVDKMNSYKSYKKINENLPIFLIAGEDDPCTGGFKGRKKSFEILQKAGFKNIIAETYPNMRHEILQENDNDFLYRDIIDYLKLRVAK